ncbi:MAG TPA: hypothetical protein VHX17_10345 [Candidatus Cybelea sp.]|jgi:hypothetical protein|nr:hypothetical protein [Candidatus Cybelea sp.]
MPSGFYHYVISAKSDKNRIGCERQGYLAALSGRPQTLEGALDNGVVDPITQLLFAGILPEGVSATVVRYAGDPPCGSATGTLTSYALLSSAAAKKAYYAFDDAFTAKHIGTVTFGLELHWPGGAQRTVRLLAQYPNEIISGPPTFRRFDVTKPVSQELLGDSPGVLLCPASASS